MLCFYGYSTWEGNTLEVCFHGYYNNYQVCYVWCPWRYTDGQEVIPIGTLMSNCLGASTLSSGTDFTQIHAFLVTSLDS